MQGNPLVIVGFVIAGLATGYLLARLNTDPLTDGLPSDLDQRGLAWNARLHERFSDGTQFETLVSALRSARFEVAADGANTATRLVPQGLFDRCPTVLSAQWVRQGDTVSEVTGTVLAC